MSGLLAQPALGSPTEPPSMPSGAPPGAPPEGSRFQSALDAEWARTAPAEGQQQSSASETPHVPVANGETPSEEAHSRELREGAADTTRQEPTKHGRAHHRESTSARPRPAAKGSTASLLADRRSAAAEPAVPSSSASNGPSTDAQAGEASRTEAARGAAISAATADTTQSLPGTPRAGDLATSPAAASAASSTLVGAPSGEQPKSDLAASSTAPAATGEADAASSLSAATEAPLSSTGASVAPTPTADASANSAPTNSAPVNGDPVDSAPVDDAAKQAAETDLATEPTGTASPGAPTISDEARAAAGASVAAGAQSEAVQGSAAAPAVGEHAATAAATGAATLTRTSHDATSSSQLTGTAGTAAAPTPTATTTASGTHTGTSGDDGSTGRQATTAALAQTPVASRPATTTGLPSLLGAGAAESSGQAATPGAAAPSSYGVELHQTIEAVNATIDLAARQGLTQARIELSPEELGEIRIHLTQTTAGLSARVTAESPAAAQALAAGHAELRQSLRSLGLTLTRLDIGHHNDGLSASADGRDSGARNAPRGEVAPRRADTGRITAAADSDPQTTDAEPTGEAQTAPVAEPGALVDVLA
jgi:hypothetical protein